MALDPPKKTCVCVCAKWQIRSVGSWGPGGTFHENPLKRDVMREDGGVTCSSLFKISSAQSVVVGEGEMVATILIEFMSTTDNEPNRSRQPDTTMLWETIFDRTRGQQNSNGAFN